MIDEVDRILIERGHMELGEVVVIVAGATGHRRFDQLHPRPPNRRARPLGRRVADRYPLVAT